MQPILESSSYVVAVDAVFLAVDPVRQEQQHVRLAFYCVVGKLELARCEIFGINVHTYS